MNSILPRHKDLATGNLTNILNDIYSDQGYNININNKTYYITSFGKIYQVVIDDNCTTFTLKSNIDVSTMFKYVINKSEKYQYRGSNFYLRSGLYTSRGTIHTDRKLTMIPRSTQGLGVVMTYGFEALTSLSSAFSYYLMYKTGKNIYTVATEFKPDLTVLETLKKYFLELTGILAIAYRYYMGYIDNKGALSELMLLGGFIIGKSVLASFIMNALRQSLVHSTNRETQAFEPTTLLQNIISLISIIGLGYVQTGVDPKTIISSIKGLGSTILTVKTVEQVFINVITYLPDIMQHIIADYCPAFGLYVKLNTDSEFKENVNRIHQLKTMNMTDVLYNSHNLAVFLRVRSYFINILNNDRGGFLHKYIPEIINWIDTTYELVYDRGLAPGCRPMPFVVWVSGDPGVGKSAMMYSLARQFLKSILKDEDVTDVDIQRYIYSHNTSNKYFDGYNNQPIFILNDYLQFSQESEEQWLIRFADTIDCPLEVSSVDNIATGVKGEVRFTSHIILITSNTTYLGNSAIVTNSEAFNRRRNVVIDMSFKPGREVNSHWDYDWCVIKRLPNVRTNDHVHTYEGNERTLMINNECTQITMTPFQAMLNDIDLTYSHFKQFSYNYNLTHAERTPPASIFQSISISSTTQSVVDSVFNKLWLSIHSIFDKDFFGIKFKYLIPLVVGTTSAVYCLYNSMIPYFASKFTQSLSGDVGTSKIRKVTKPITKIVMGQSQNNMEIFKKISNNYVRVTVRMTNGNVSLTQVMWGISLGGSIILTPKHLWQRGDMVASEGDSITIERGLHKHEMILRDDMLYLDENNDFAALNILGTMPTFKSLRSMMLEHNTQIDVDGEDIVILNPTMNESGVLVSAFELKGYITDAIYKDDAGRIYEGRNIWQYNHKFMKGDCGSVVVLQTKSGIKFAGIHVAGDSYSGNAEVITAYQYNLIMDYFSKGTQGFSCDCEMDQDEYFDAVSDLEGEFYFLGKSKKAPYQIDKTEIRKSPLFEVLQPCKTGPAVLSPSDARLIEPVSPMLKSVAKYGTHVIPFSNYLLEKAYVIVKEMYRPIFQYDLRVDDYDDTINAIHYPNLEKLDLKTSAGYPWNVKQKSKRDLISVDDKGVLSLKQELRDKLIRYDKLLDNNIMFPYTLTTTLKDERVGLEKIKIGKTRTFMNFPVEYTILMRKYFDAFIDKETKHAMEIGTTVGINIYSTQWHNLYTILKKFDCTLDGDFKAFDGTIRPEFFRLYSRLVNECYHDTFGKKRDLLVSGCCFAPMFVLDKVYFKLQGNPSGSRITTSFNSFVNRMYIVMSLLHNLPEAYHTPYFINTNTKIFAHGDDHIIGFTSLISRYWGGFALRDFMLAHGIEYTSSEKEKDLVNYRPLHECFYLKSYFVYDKVSGTYRAGLSKDVIQEMVSWQRDDDLSSTEMICNTALRYAYFWGKDYFNEIRDKLVSSIRSKHLSFPYRNNTTFNVIDYISLDIEYRHSGELIFQFN